LSARMNLHHDHPRIRRESYY